MNKVRSGIFLILVTLISINIMAQEVVTIDLNIRAEDETYKRTQAIIPLFRYAGQPFEDISNFGAESKKEPNYFHATLPDMTGIKDTFYAYIYSDAAKNKALPGYFFAIIGNNKRNKKPTPIWIDRNSNLDLTDDGPPDTISSLMQFQDITISNPGNSNGKHLIRISRFSYREFIQYKYLLNQHYKSHSGNKKFAKANYSFREQRLNILAGDYTNGSDSFRLGIKDFNCNGLFNEKEMDVLMLSSYGENTFFNETIEIPKNKNTIFEWRNKQYKIVEIAEDGSSIKIKENVGATLLYALNIGEKLPKFKYCKAQNKPIKLKSKKLKKKPIFIFFWNNRYERFEKDTSFLRLLQEEFGDRIHILALNYGNTPTQIRRIRLLNGLEWTIGFSTLAINELFYVKEVPRGFYTDSKQRLTNTSISPEQLYNQLKNSN
jgi:hypothetical protein